MACQKPIFLKPRPASYGGLIDEKYNSVYSFKQSLALTPIFKRGTGSDEWIRPWHSAARAQPCGRASPGPPGRIPARTAGALAYGPGAMRGDEAGARPASAASENIVAMDRSPSLPISTVRSLTYMRTNSAMVSRLLPREYFMA